ncbi:hypothetical protein M514_08877 [Trichuris suis]|uniref:Integrase zinc-binding domain-containing protein n=1 Tax=Trichuris suis TaxID=68888 RepID=A0A085NBT6_9BILA|nr:hypothetical protein M513_08877 [Trichuris suis]KFD66932.1 hypothetical protein M514_08877 [Trichuris suis]
MHVTNFSHSFQTERMFCFFAPSRNCKSKSGQKNTGLITLSEVNGAERRIWQLVQEECFPRELVSLKKGNTVPKDSDMRNLDVYLDSEGLIPVGGRLQFASLSYASKHPAVLSRHHHVVSLLIMQCHERQMHMGIEHTLATLRQKVWILHGAWKIFCEFCVSVLSVKGIGQNRCNKKWQIFQLNVYSQHFRLNELVRTLQVHCTYAVMLQMVAKPLCACLLAWLCAQSIWN